MKTKLLFTICVVLGIYFQKELIQQYQLQLYKTSLCILCIMMIIAKIIIVRRKEVKPLDIANYHSSIFLLCTYVFFPIGYIGILIEGNNIISSLFIGLSWLSILGCVLSIIMMCIIDYDDTFAKPTKKDIEAKKKISSLSCYVMELCLIILSILLLSSLS